MQSAADFFVASVAISATVHVEGQRRAPRISYRMTLLRSDVVMQRMNQNFSCGLIAANRREKDSAHCDVQQLGRYRWLVHDPNGHRNSGHCLIITSRWPRRLAENVQSLEIAPEVRFARKSECVGRNSPPPSQGRQRVFWEI
jgi:hypothetical protein